MKINIDNIDTDIGLEQARRAHYNVSFSPEKRGDRVVADYIAALTDLAAFIEETSKAPEQQAIAQQLFDDLRGKYRAKFLNGLGRNPAAYQAQLQARPSFRCAGQKRPMTQSISALAKWCISIAI